MEEGFHVDGLDLILSKMNQLEAAVGAKALRSAGKDAMKPVLVHMRSAAHVGTERTSRIAGYQGGDLRDSIVMTSKIGSRRSNKRLVTIKVGPLRNKYKGRRLSNITQKALAQEYGNENFRADPFIRPALDRRKRQVIGSLERHFSRRFKKIWEKKR